MEWSNAEVERLRVLWAEGHSSAQIGLRLGLSKNAVIGKARRMGLDPRPSPIIKDGRPRRPPSRRVRAGATTLPALSALSVPERTPHVPVRPAELVHPARIPVTRGQRVVPPQIIAPTPAPRPFAHAIDCCWPIGEPGTPSFHFCDMKAIPGRPYCEPHCQLAYVRVADRREDEAAPKVGGQMSSAIR